MINQTSAIKYAEKKISQILKELESGGVDYNDAIASLEDIESDLFKMIDKPQDDNTFLKLCIEFCKYKGLKGFVKAKLRRGLLKRFTLEELRELKI